MNKFLILVLLISANIAHANQTCEQEFQNIPDGPEKTRAIGLCMQHQAAQQNLQNNNQNSNNVPYNDCRQTLSLMPGPVELPATQLPAQYCEQVCVDATPNTPPAPSTSVSWSGTGIPATHTAKLQLCRGYEGIANRLGSSLAAVDRKESHDRKIFCVQKSGITADWESCTSALSMYNSIVIAEAAMQVFQGVQQNRAEGQAQDQYAQRAASGDAQNAAYDAQIAQVNSAKQLNQQQAMAYTTAVAALYSKIQSWIKEDKQTFIQKGCGTARTPAQNEQAPAQTKVYASVESASPQENCVSSAEQAFDPYKGFIYANRDAKAAFTTAAMMFAAKAIAAGIKASQLGNIAKKVEESKKQTENPYDAPTFEYCKVNNLDPKCAGPSTVTSGSGLQDGGFSFGEGFGNNAFNPIGEEDTLGGVEPLPLPGDEVVPDASNPFTDDAKVANGILDPAAAASLQPGTAGGNGSGGAPGLGGGSASLGNDTPGMDDSKKENDIKANKADGKYNIAGGGAFQAIKPMKDENPFANLFDGKGGGKLEEDRSIASGDIDGQDSGLFSKISRRYGQVQADKRIEAKNLDAE